MMHANFRAGLAVFTRDGETVGPVREVAERSFNVHVPWGVDFRLDVDCLREAVVESDRVVLDFTKHQLGEHIVGPRPTMTANR
jgi:hypothetical protein